MKYKVLGDSENIYEEGTIIFDEDLINDFLDCCNQTEDADYIGWLMNLPKDEAVEEICSAWGIRLQKIEEEYN